MCPLSTIRQSVLTRRKYRDGIGNEIRMARRIEINAGAPPSSQGNHVKFQYGVLLARDAQLSAKSWQVFRCRIECALYE